MNRTEVTNGRKTLELPFQPFDGLMMQWRGWPRGPITELVWDIEEQHFYGSLEESAEVFEDGYNDVGFLVEMAKAEGYEGFQKKMVLGEEGWELADFE